MSFCPFLVVVVVVVVVVVLDILLARSKSLTMVPLKANFFEANKNYRVQLDGRTPGATVELDVFFKPNEWPSRMKSTDLQKPLQL